MATAAGKARAAARAAYARTHAAPAPGADWLEVPGGELVHRDVRDLRARPDGDGYQVEVFDRHGTTRATIAQTENGELINCAPLPAPRWRALGHVATLGEAYARGVAALLRGDLGAEGGAS